MRLDVTKAVVLALSPDAVWAFVRQPALVAECLPNVSELAPVGTDRYTTLLVERLGPFSVRIPLEIRVTEDAAGREIVAHVSGDDRGGQARVRGDVRASVVPSAPAAAGDQPGAEGEAARLEVVSAVEVLGRMATLGAIPMRRRADQVFEQFIHALEARVMGGSTRARPASPEPEDQA